MSDKIPFTLAEHQALGAQLKAMWEWLVETQARLSRGSRNDSKVVGRVIAARKALDALRCELDNQVERDQRACGGDIDRETLNHAYYPPNNRHKKASAIK